MQWEIQLSGSNEDLTALEQSMNSGDMRIFSRSNQFFLEWVGFELLHSPEEVFASATNLLQMLTGASSLALGMRKPLEVAVIVKNCPDGKGEAHMFLKEFASAASSETIFMTTTDGSSLIIRPADPVPKWIDLAVTNKPVAKALRLIGSGIEDWVSLYRLFEVVVDDLGGIKKTDALGWIGNGALENFKRTANSPETIGDHARHGPERGTRPPKLPMELADAKAMVILLVHKWLKGKLP